MKLTRHSLALGLLCAAFGLSAAAQEAVGQASTCGDLANHYGPYDYRIEKDRALAIVGVHFTYNVEHLIRGNTGHLGQDLSYTLHTSPNHHRALISLANWGVKLKGLQPPHMRYSVDCYFDRAFRFRPDDRVPQLIYIDYLNRLGRKADAMKTAEPLLRATNLDVFTRNNLGLLMFDLGNYDEALKQCHLAMAEGWTRTDLKERLQAVGHWQEPAPQQPASAPAPSASAASAP